MRKLFSLFAILFVMVGSMMAETITKTVPAEFNGWYAGWYASGPGVEYEVAEFIANIEEFYEEDNLAAEIWSSDYKDYLTSYIDWGNPGNNYYGQIVNNQFSHSSSVWPYDSYWAYFLVSGSELDAGNEWAIFISYVRRDDIFTTPYKRGVFGQGLKYVANQDPQSSSYFTTFQSASSRKLKTEGVSICKAEVFEEGGETYMVMTEIGTTGDVIPANTPVILKSSTPNVILCSSSTPDAGGTTIDATGNALLGVNVTTPVSNLGAGTIYTLSAEDVNGQMTMAFYQFAGTEIPAEKAYLKLPASASAPRRICFGTNTTTGMENTAADVKAEKILRDGQLLIKKNGHLYNVQGAVVE